MKHVSNARNNSIKAIGILFFIVTMIITQTGCNSNKEPVSEEGYYLDTVCQLTVYDMKGGLDEKKAKKAIDAAFDLCRQLDKTLSNTVEASDISKINNAGSRWVEVSDDAVTVIKAGIEYGKLSEGAFDITIGGVTSLWNFHSDNPTLPDAAVLNEALTHVNYKNIEVDGNKVRVLDPKAKIDLGGIAKGYIGDRLADKLKELGVTSGIVNLGGNVITIDGKPDGSDFIVGIEKPFSDHSDTVGSTKVKEKTVVTSGVYERQFEKDGVLYYHVLDARTGYPVKTDLDSASLVMEYGHSMDADALSTICLMKGSKSALEFMDSREDIKGILCLHDGNIFKSKGMKLDK